MNDRSKLPKWAQQEMTRLENSAEYHKARLVESLGQNGPHSDTQVYMGYQEPTAGLPNGTPIHFKLSYGKVEVRVNEGRLEISSPHGGLSIFPHVTNVVQVAVVPR